MQINTGGGVNGLGSGTVTIGDAANTGAVATLHFNGSGGFPIFSNALSSTGSGTNILGVTGFNPTFNDGLTGTGNITVSINANNGNSFVNFGTAAVNNSGTLTLTGTNTNTGATTISAGRLIVGNGTSGSLANTSVTVGGDGSSGTPTLGGRGTIAGATTIYSARTGVVATHAPGVVGANGNVGTQTFSNGLSYQSGSIFEWDLKTAAVGAVGTDFDAVALNTTGSLSVDGNDTTGSIFKVVLGETFSGGNTFWSNPVSWNVFTATSPAALGSNVFARFPLFDTSSTTVPVDFSSYGSFGFTNNGSAAAGRADHVEF